MRAKVDENMCVGTGTCEDLCPKVFKVENGISQVQVDEVPEGEESNAQSAADNCPMNAIEIE